MNPISLLVSILLVFFQSFLHTGNSFAAGIKARAHHTTYTHTAIHKKFVRCHTTYFSLAEDNDNDEVSIASATVIAPADSRQEYPFGTTEAASLIRGHFTGLHHRYRFLLLHQIRV